MHPFFPQPHATGEPGTSSQPQLPEDYFISASQPRAPGDGSPPLQALPSLPKREKRAAQTLDVQRRLPKDIQSDNDESFSSPHSSPRYPSPNELFSDTSQSSCDPRLVRYSTRKRKKEQLKQSGSSESEISPSPCPHQKRAWYSTDANSSGSEYVPNEKEMVLDSCSDSDGSMVLPLTGVLSPSNPFICAQKNHDLYGNETDDSGDETDNSDDDYGLLENRDLICDESDDNEAMENLVNRDISNPQIYIRKVLKCKQGKNGLKKREFVYNGTHACFYCAKLFTNICKHLRARHKNEEEVKNIMLIKNKKEARIHWDILRNKGDNQNNINVLEACKGEIILGRRPKEQFNVASYGPCPLCLEWLRLDITLVKHQKVCPKKEVNIQTKGEIRMKSDLIAGRLSSLASQKLLEEVFPIMTNDAATAVAKQDPLIITLGNAWLSKNIGNPLKRKYYASYHMRNSARLLINLRNLTKEPGKAMKDYLKPCHFDDFCKATLQTASVAFDDEEDLKSPSTAIRCGFDIKRMIDGK